MTPGVGPSTALAALRTMRVPTSSRGAIEHDDVKRIATIPGIGPKTASRIVLELKGKLSPTGTYESSAASALRTSAIEDALRGLGLLHARRSVKPLEDVDAARRRVRGASRVALQLLRRA